MKIIYTLISFLIGSHLLFAQNVLSLNDAIRLGLGASPTAEILEKQIEINENNNIKASTGTTPSISLNASIPFSFNKTFGERFFTFGIIPEDSRVNYTGLQNFSIDGQWPLYTGGRGGLIQEQLDLSVQQSELNLNQDDQLKVLDITQAYYNVVLQQERLDVIEEVIKLSKDRIAFEEIKKEFGTSNSFNIIQLEDALLNDTTDLLNQITTIENVKRILLRTLNQDLDISTYNINEELDENFDLLDEDILLSKLIEKNVNLSNLELAKKFAEINSKVQESQRKPILNANSSLGFTRNRSGFFGDNPTTGESVKFSTTRNYGFNIGLTASYNLFDGGLIKRDIANAKLEEEIASMNYDNMRDDMELQLLNLINEYHNNLTLLDIIDQKLKLVQENILIADERFKSGSINSFDYRNVQLSYLNTSYSRLQILYNIVFSKSNIDWLTGAYSTIE